MYSTFGSDWPTATIRVKIHYFANTDGSSPQVDATNSAVLLSKLNSFYQTSSGGDSQIRFSLTFAETRNTAYKLQYTNNPFDINTSDLSVLYVPRRRAGRGLFCLMRVPLALVVLSV